MTTIKHLLTPTARARLAIGRRYKLTLNRGCHLVYRMATSGIGTWAVYAADGKGGQTPKVFASADDKQPADGVSVLTYEQAAAKALQLARGDSNAVATGLPKTIAEALDAYATTNPFDARTLRGHLPAHLLAQPANMVTADQLNDWRDGLRADLKASTLNRLTNSLRAALNRAGKRDKRVMSNADAWSAKHGLEKLPEADSPRIVYLEDACVVALVAAANTISDAFGLFVQVHAETGARSSQLARMLVDDFGGDHLLIPCSKKGGKDKERPPVIAKLNPGLAARLRAATAGRPADAPLFVDENGQPWGWTKSDNRRHIDLFQRAVQTVAATLPLPKDTTLYAFRHTSIKRLLLRNLPIKAVAEHHDTGIGPIEKNYARFLLKHTVDLIRDNSIDTSPPLKLVG